MTIKILHIIITLFMLAYFAQDSYADTADVLPKGVVSFDTTYYHYFDITKRYNPDGDSEDLAADYNGDLNSNVFPDLAALDTYVGGNATIGKSVVDFTYFYRWFEFMFAYGITDKLTLGVLLPYNYTKNEVNARLDSSTANVGKNPIYGTGGDPFGSPLIPIAYGGVPMNTKDVQNLLGRGLDVNGDGVIDIPGYKYKKFKTWSDSLVGDIEVGAKYQLYNKDPWAFAFATGVRLPTGQEDDPDNLVDLAPGDGQTDILFRLFADYKGIKNLLLNATLYYDVQLPDKQTLRVPENVNRPITANKEDVDRNLGDIIELEMMGNYSFTPQVSTGIKYHYTKKFKDSVNGDKGLAYSSLEDETDSTSHMILLSLGYNTLQMYMDKKFPVPFYTNITYRNRFAGTNNVTKSQYLSLNLGFYF